MCIEHQGELDFLAQTLQRMNLSSEYFIGLEKKNKKWSWICNKTIVVKLKQKPWATSQPSGNGLCAKMYFEGKVLVYDDIRCDDKMDYICERRRSSCHTQGWFKTPEIHSLRGASRLPLSLSLSLSL